MKKFLTLALTAVMALSLLTACGSKNDNSADTNTDGSNTCLLYTSPSPRDS